MTTGLDASLTFEAFVPGAANQLALAAARALAESAAPPFVPLYLHGPPGTGKSHLLHAIGARALAVMPGRTVRCVTWSELAEGLRTAHALGRVADFLAPVESADLLLLDGVRPDAPVGELRHDLVAVLRGRVAHRQPTVLAGPPALLDPEIIPPELDPLVPLLRAGLAVELHAPDRDLRRAVLSHRAARDGGGLSPAVLDAVADLPLMDLRDVIGAWQRLVAFQAVSHAPLEVAQARVLVTGVAEPASERPAPGRAVVAAVPATPVSTGNGAGDEYGTFLSDVVASVSQQVDTWRRRVADAILRWDGEGYRTERLQALLAADATVPPDAALAQYEQDIAALRQVQAELAVVAPDLAVSDVFCDPDRVAAASDLLQAARTADFSASAPALQWTFATLAEGIANRQVLQALHAVVEGDASVPLPLLVVGDAGVGKTHALHALGNALVSRGRRGVVVLGGHAFAAQVAEARAQGTLPAWRSRFRWATALCLDDAHLLATDLLAQEEAAALIAEFVASQRPVVCTSAVPLAQLAGGSVQFLSRLASGMVMDLPAPDREIRRAVAEARLASAGEERAALADFIADLPLGTVRAVEAAAQQVLRAAEADGAPAGLAMARAILLAAPATPAALPPAGRGIRAFGWDRLREKLVGDWPTPSDQLFEEYR